MTYYKNNYYKRYNNDSEDWSKLTYNGDWDDDEESIEELYEYKTVPTKTITISDAITKNKSMGYPDVRGTSRKQVAFATKVRLDNVKRFMKNADPETLLSYIDKNKKQPLQLDINESNVIDIMINNYITMYTDAKDIFELNDRVNGGHRAILYATKLLLQCNKL